MFVVTPFEKPPSIRSALGFMSLTSRWGALMFPGITVLTRDFIDIVAMHRVIKRFKDERKNLSFLKTRDADDEYAHEIKSLLKYNGSKEKFKQQMTYWQRYGSFVSYFDLFNADKVPDVNRYKNIVFGESNPKKGEPSDLLNEKRPLSRAVRVENSNWYREFRDQIVEYRLAPDSINHILSDTRIMWWITGMDAPRGLGIPKVIKMSREMEFALTVWQTLFECSSILLHKGLKIPRRTPKLSSPIEHFLKCFVEINSGAATDETLFELASCCLCLHEQLVSKVINSGWEKEFATWVDKIYGVNHLRFVTCHNQSYSINKLADLGSAKLLEALAKVHVGYCEVQQKRSSIYVKSFESRSLGDRIPDVSSSFGGGRWGLFGYRLEASVGLFQSRKYEKI